MFQIAELVGILQLQFMQFGFHHRAVGTTQEAEILDDDALLGSGHHAGKLVSLQQPVAVAQGQAFTGEGTVCQNFPAAGTADLQSPVHHGGGVTLGLGAEEAHLHLGIAGKGIDPLQPELAVAFADAEMHVILGIKSHYGSQVGGAGSIESRCQRGEQHSFEIHHFRRLEVMLEAVAANAQQQQGRQYHTAKVSQFSSWGGIWRRALRRSSLLNSSGSLMGSWPGI